MPTETMSLFFALLALACLLSVVVVAIGAVLRATGLVRLHVARQELGRVAVPLAWAVALVATFGSLYYSEVAGFTPCPLCWYQRICMYPLALVLGIATFRRDPDVRWYALPLAAVGLVVAVYHSWIQAFPPAGGSAFCTLDAPCTDRFVWELGFVSIPFMAMCAFAFVVAMMLLARPERPAATD